MTDMNVQTTHTGRTEASGTSSVTSFSYNFDIYKVSVSVKQSHSSPSGRVTHFVAENLFGWHKKDANEYYQEGMTHWRKIDYRYFHARKAAEKFYKAAELGHSEAVYKLYKMERDKIRIGFNYSDLKSLPIPIPKGCLRKAAEAGHPKCRHIYAEKLLERWDIESATEMFEKNVEEGDPEGLRLIAEYYFKSLGHTEMLLKSLIYYRRYKNKVGVAPHNIKEILHLCLYNGSLYTLNGDMVYDGYRSSQLTQELRDILTYANNFLNKQGDWIETTLEKATFDRSEINLRIRGLLTFEANEFYSDEEKIDILIQILKRDMSYLGRIRRYMPTIMKPAFEKRFLELRPEKTKAKSGKAEA